MYYQIKKNIDIFNNDQIHSTASKLSLPALSDPTDERETKRSRLESVSLIHHPADTPFPEIAHKHLPGGSFEVPLKRQQARPRRLAGARLGRGPRSVTQPLYRPIRILSRRYVVSIAVRQIDDEAWIHRSHVFICKSISKASRAPARLGSQSVE